MGQRTQILVIREKTDGTSERQLFHEQWGYGRQMYLSAMNFFIHYYMDDYFNRQKFSLVGQHDETKWFTEHEDFKDYLLGATADDLDSIRRLFKHCDNNNGGMVFYIKETKNEERVLDDVSFKVGFLLGYEDETATEKAFSRWLSPEEYGRLNGGNDYSDERFVKIFTDFCEYFGIEYLK